MKTSACKDLPTQEELHRLFDYDPETGVLTWAVAMNSRAPAGRLAGTLNHGYRQVQIHKRLILVHRVVWCYVHAEWPPAGLQIDHINRIGDDNRISNLRLATPLQNGANTKTHSNNTSGTSGVVWDKNRQKWRASVGFSGRTVYLGRFNLLSDAIAARVAGVQEYHAEFAYQGAAA